MGRWGWRQVAALCVSVWVVAACQPAPPTTTPSPSLAEATLHLHTAAPASSVTSSAVTPRASAAPSQTLQARPSRPPAVVPTPPPLPTARYHTVAAEETLARIAAQYGLTVEALRAANGGLLPGQVYPGQVLLIPPPPRPTETLARLLPTDTPLPLTLPEPTCYPTLADEVLCLGWVHNAFDTPLTDVIIRVTLRGAAGVLQDERTVALLQTLLPPGQGAPYTARFSPAPHFSSAEAQVISAGNALLAGLAVQPLEVQADRHTVEGALVRVRAELSFAGEGQAEDVLVVVALRDAAGHVTGLRTWRPGVPLAAGEKLVVDLVLTPLGTVATEQVYAEGRPVP